MTKTIHWYDYRARKKKKAKDDFEKDFFKLMNTAAFGKTMKNVTKHREIKLAKSQEGINWYQNQTTLFALKFA